MEYLQEKKSFLVSHKLHFLVLLKCSGAVAEDSIDNTVNITIQACHPEKENYSTLTMF